MADYRISDLSVCEVSTIMNHEERFQLPLWNLFYLSVPGVDALAEYAKTPRWFMHYKCVSQALSSLTHEVCTDPVLERKLCMHPARFLEWFRREDHMIYESAYPALGGSEWVKTVERRAAEASYRLANTLPPDMQGKNIYAFIQKNVHDAFRDGTSSL